MVGGVLALAGVGLGFLACAGSGTPRDASHDYLPYASIEVPVNEHVLLRWAEGQMPLQVHLPMPPAEMFPDPQAVHDSVRDGILDWTDVARPGVPSFEFVDAAGDADIPIVWATKASGDWYVAFCAWDLDLRKRRFGVAHILVTARWQNDELVDLTTLYEVMLHEMGHALGIMGHSPHPEDIMYAERADQDHPAGLSPRDRNTLRRVYERPIGSHVGGARGKRAYY